MLELFESRPCAKMLMLTQVPVIISADLLAMFFSSLCKL